MADGETANQLTRTLVIAVLLLVSLGVTLGPALLRSIERGHVLESGIEARATIIDVIDTGNRENSDPEVRIVLNVTPDDREAFSTEVVTVLSVVDVPKYQAGRALRVKFDPDEPSSIAIVGLEP